jgi:hypothetical protein
MGKVGHSPLPRGEVGARSAPGEGKRYGTLGAEKVAPLPLTLATLDLSLRER